jgi:hypothetical protein
MRWPRGLTSPAVFGVFDFRRVIAYPMWVTGANGAPGKVIYLGACLIAAVRLGQLTPRGQQNFRCYRLGEADL